MVPDNLSLAQRTKCMSSVRNRDTDIECSVRSELHKRGFRFLKHVKEIPGTPDIVFTRKKIAVFIDGDFWHGYMFTVWKHKVSVFWQEKIEINRERDRRNHRKLRRMGWKVIRLWKHDIKKDLSGSVDRIIEAINSRMMDSE